MKFDVEAEFEKLDRPCEYHNWIDSHGDPIDADICPDCIKALLHRAIDATREEVEGECIDEIGKAKDEAKKNVQGDFDRGVVCALAQACVIVHERRRRREEEGT